MIRIGIDWDDTLCPFVEHAVALCNSDNGTNFQVSDITCWGSNGSVATESVVPYYSDIRTFYRQNVLPEAKEFFNNLRKVADVYIMTAVEPRLMSFRADQIFEAFPDFPADHILMGSAKNLVNFDILLDDAPHNILKAGATYPVLLRKPWNANLSGVLAVNTYEEFMVLVDQIKTAMVENIPMPDEPCVYAIVGPSGSRKQGLASTIRNKKNCVESPSYQIDSGRVAVPGEAITDTIYAGHRYTMSKTFIQKSLSSGKSVTAVVDMSGAMALKKEFPTVLIFCRRSREGMIAEVLDDLMNGILYKEEANLRLLSMEQELKNEILCDVSVRTDNYEDIDTFVDTL